MSGVLYLKLAVDFRTRASIVAKIAEIDIIINSLTAAMTEAILTSKFAEYDLDTGQTRTRIKYTSVSDMKTHIQDFEDLRTFYEVKLQGRHVRLVDSKNFRN